MATLPVDHELVKGLQEQKSNALEKLYDSYGGMMYGLAFKILGNRQEAEDVIQDIFLKLWHHCSYDPQRGSLQSFLMLLVRSKAIDQLRSHKAQANTVQRSHHLELGELSGRSPLETVAADEVSQRVQEALASLPDQQRRALQLSYFGGMTQKEIAQQLQVPLGTVKSYFRLSFTKLRQLLQDLIH